MEENNDNQQINVLFDRIEAVIEKFGLENKEDLIERLDTIKTAFANGETTGDIEGKLFPMVENAYNLIGNDISSNDTDVVNFRESFCNEQGELKESDEIKDMFEIPNRDISAADEKITESLSEKIDQFIQDVDTDIGAELDHLKSSIDFNNRDNPENLYHRFQYGTDAWETGGREAFGRLAADIEGKLTDSENVDMESINSTIEESVREFETGSPEARLEKAEETFRDVESKYQNAIKLRADSKSLSEEYGKALENYKSELYKAMNVTDADISKYEKLLGGKIDSIEKVELTCVLKTIDPSTIDKILDSKSAEGFKYELKNLLKESERVEAKSLIGGNSSFTEKLKVIIEKYMPKEGRQEVTKERSEKDNDNSDNKKQKSKDGGKEYNSSPKQNHYDRMADKWDARARGGYIKDSYSAISSIASSYYRLRGASAGVDKARYATQILSGTFRFLSTNPIDTLILRGFEALFKVIFKDTFTKEDVEAFGKRIEKIDKEIASTDKKISDVSTKISAETKSLETSKSDLSELQSKIKGFESNLSATDKDLIKQYDSLNKDISSLDAKIKKIEGQSGGVSTADSKRLETLNAERTAKKEELEKVSSKIEESTDAKSYIEARDRISELKNDISRLSKDIPKLENEERWLRVERGDLVDERQQLKDNIEKYEKAEEKAMEKGNRKEIEPEKSETNVEPKPPNEKVEATQPNEKVEATQPNEKVEATPPNEKVEATQPNEKVEATPPNEKVEAAQPNEKVATAHDGNPVAANEGHKITKGDVPEEAMSLDDFLKTASSDAKIETFKDFVLQDHDIHDVENAFLKTENGETIFDPDSFFEKFDEFLGKIDINTIGTEDYLHLRDDLLRNYSDFAEINGGNIDNYENISNFIEHGHDMELGASELDTGYMVNAEIEINLDGAKMCITADEGLILDGNTRFELTENDIEKFKNDFWSEAKPAIKDAIDEGASDIRLYRDVDTGEIRWMETPSIDTQTYTGVAQDEPIHRDNTDLGPPDNLITNDANDEAIRQAVEENVAQETRVDPVDQDLPSSAEDVMSSAESAVEEAAEAMFG